MSKDGIDAVTDVTHVPVSPEAMTELVLVLFANLPGNMRGMDQLDIDLRIECRTPRRAGRRSRRTSSSSPIPAKARPSSS